MFVGFLERIEQLPDVVARRRRSYELLALRPGDLVADVGCGLGTAARELAALGVRVIGFDASEAMVAEAGRRSGGASVEFAIADVSAPSRWKTALLPATEPSASISISPIRARRSQKRGACSHRAGALSSSTKTGMRF